MKFSTSGKDFSKYINNFKYKVQLRKLPCKLSPFNSLLRLINFLGVKTRCLSALVEKTQTFIAVSAICLVSRSFLNMGVL